jgi:uncharacterized protein
MLETEDRPIGVERTASGSVPARMIGVLAQPLARWWAARRERGVAMDWASEWKPLLLIAGGFLLVYHLPVGTSRFDGAVVESLQLVRWYAREHVLLCLIPAFFIAGAIAVFVSQQSILKYLGARARKVVAYGVASVSGTVLAVCSCTVLPLFAGIYRTGAGLGPATTFLYSGPAINVLAIILTARVLGWQLGLARAVGAVLFSVVIGVLMHLIFRREELERARVQAALPPVQGGRPLWQTGVYFLAMVGILVFANWGAPAAADGFWLAVYQARWLLTAGFALLLGFALVRWLGMGYLSAALVTLPAALLALLFPGQPLFAFGAAVVGLSVVTSTASGELGDWFASSWSFARQIVPLLLVGVLIAGLLLGRPGHEGLIPSAWISGAVGGNSAAANLFAAVAGGLMYFATLTEVPILQGLMGSGMGDGPALALLLAGPAVSLPSLLVIHSVLGTRKTLVFTVLVIVMAAITGMAYGAMMGGGMI